MLNYDLKNDEDYSSYVEGLCLANLPIEFYGQHLRHITVREALLMGEKRYSDLIIPFCLTPSVVFKENVKNVYLLEMLALPELNKYLEFTVDALKLFFDTENISVIKTDNFGVEIVVNNSLFLDKIKFEELSNIILKMCNATKITKDNLKKSEGERTLTLEQIENIKDRRERDYQMAIYKNNQKNKSKQKKTKALYNVYNFVCNNDVVDYEKPLGFNLYQLYNTFNINHQKDNYKYTMRIVTSGMCSDTKKLDLRPLSQQIAK